MLSTVSEKDAPNDAALDHDLLDLSKISTEIDTVERTLEVLRTRRDQAIRDAVGHGASERAAARSAQVSASYAHYAAKHGALTMRVLRERRLRSR